MADPKAMTEAIMQAAIEATKAVVQAIAVAEAGNRPGSRPVRMRSKLDRPTLKNPTFYWSATDKYAELSSLRLEVNNVFKTYNTNYADSTSIIKKWLCRQGLQFTEALSQTEKETGKMVEGLFGTMNNDFRLSHNEIISSVT